MIAQMQTLPEAFLPQINSIVPPQGWFPEEEILYSKNINDSTLQSFQQTVSTTLPEAAKRSEELIDTLNDRLGIDVSISYLSVDIDANYHVLLLVTERDYHSPNIRAARLLAEKFVGNSSNLAIRYTFTVGRERIMSHFTTTDYRLKYVHHMEPSPAMRA